MRNSIQDVLSFWFEESVPSQWFQVNDVFDEMIRDRFLDLYHLAVRGVCDEWARRADGALALILLFDQFPRNMFRETPQAFSTDSRALAVSRQAIGVGYDQLVGVEKRRFFYLPFEHSENVKDQERSVELFETIKEDDPLGYDYAVRHYEVIKKFGRFPHRNMILNRETTAGEAVFLSEYGRGF